MAKTIQATEIPLDKLVVSKFNVRKNLGDLSELVNSIRLKGVLQPIVVRPSGNKYEVVIGSRRLAAARELRLPTIPAIIREMDDQEALLESLTENFQRNNLQPREQGEAVNFLRNTFKMTQQEVAKQLGLAQSRISEIEVAYQLLIKLEESGRRVEFYPRKEARERGDAVPFEHTYMVATAFENPEVRQVFRNMPEERVEEKKIELIKAVAPLTEERAKKVIDEFKMYPEKPIEDVKKRALAEETGVALETYLAPSVARKLRERAEKEGKPFTEMATELVERSLSVPAPEEETRVEEYGRVELPEDPLPLQIHHKFMWNLERMDGRYDFYTIGYSQVPDVNSLIEKLKCVEIKTLIDIRHDPVSQYRPEFSKDNLTRALKEAGISYVHHPELGVPREERAKVTRLEDFDSLWKWYDKNVVPKLDNVLKAGKLFEHAKPYAFMCVELDPTRCHRHRLALGLEKKGLKGYDL